MSARKYPIRAKTPSRTQHSRYGNTPTVNPQLNSRLVRSLTNLSSDSQSSGNLSIGVPKLIAPDWDLQCDLAYNEYLLAIAIQEMTQKTIQNYEQSVDDQLARQHACLRRAFQEKNKLEIEITSRELDNELRNLTLKLETIFIELNEILNNYNVIDNLDQYINFVENASNRVYLQNIKQFESQTEYDKFTSLVTLVANTMEKLKLVIDSVELTARVSEQMQTFVELRSELISKHKLLSEDLDQINFLMFKNISDKLVSLDLNNDAM